MDNLTKNQRKKNMQSIKSKNTKIEIKLRKALWNKGYRYRLHYKRAVGKPDIVFFKNKIAVFCDSEFFHGFNWIEQQNNIKSNREYWIPKIESNMTRDSLVNETLKNEGWIVIRFWSREIERNFSSVIAEIEKVLSEKKDKT